MKEAVRRRPGSCQEMVRKLPGCGQEAARRWPGSCQEVARKPCDLEAASEECHTLVPRLILQSLGPAGTLNLLVYKCPTGNDLIFWI